jgi:choline dehydrogenase-like flavoprotein
MSVLKTSSEKDIYDVIVVGSGPGGATVARETAKKKKKVLILEWGSAAPPRGTFSQYLARSLVPFKGLLFTPQLLAINRGITVGGSSLFYFATSFPVPFDMFRSRGVDLTQDAARVRADLPFIGPLPDEMMTPMATAIMESALDTGLDWKKLDKFIVTDRWRPGLEFGYFGDPADVKWSALMFVREAVKAGARLVDKARVTRVIVENRKAVGVEFTRWGKRHKAFGSRIVIAAGGIGSPVILSASGIRGVGRDFFFDPLVTVCGEHRHIEKRPDEIPMSAGAHLVQDQYLMTDMSVTRLHDWIFAAEAGRPDQIFKGKKTFRIMIKSKDALGGRLTRGGQVIKVLGTEEKKKLNHGAERARKILAKIGCRGIYRTYYFAAHPGGTAKLGEHVDADLKTEIDNLYVCDCSVIPEAWGLPPVLTILSLGTYLSRRLVSGLR